MRTVSVLAGCLAALSLAAGCQKEAGPPVSPPPPASLPATGSVAGPVAAAKGLAADGRLDVSDGDRCPICGMFPSKTPKLAGAIELADGRTFYTCGTGCLVKAHLHPEVHLRVERADLRRLVVQDYLGGRPIDAATAFWVAGSDVTGPMGRALVPLASEADVSAFRERHGGTSVFRLAELDDTRFKALRTSR